MIDYLRSHSVTGEMARKYRLGYVRDPLPGDEKFRGGLAIPYLSRKGVTAIRFRLFGSDGKIGQRKGQKNRLYNTAAYFEAGDTIGIAEGEVDALVASEVLGLPTMGVPGANGFDGKWAPLLKDFLTVFIFADGDKPGRDFASEVAEHAGWRARIVQCPDGEDISSLAAKNELGSVREVISTRHREDDDEV